jgi:hypothetical protein
MTNDQASMTNQKANGNDQEASRLPRCCLDIAVYLVIGAWALVI